MKKLLALVLALVMTLGLATVGTSAAYTDANDIDYTEAVDVMTAVGVFQGKGDAFAPKDGLNRAEAAKLIAYLMLGNKTAEAMTGSGTRFTDVPASHWAAGFIEYLASVGVVSGVGNGQFNPNGQVTAVQFAKMLLVALGYDADLEKFVGEGWSINIQKKANECDLFTSLDIRANDALTREQAAQMCLNDLKADMVEYSDKGTTVKIGESTVVTGAKQADKKTSTATKAKAISEDKDNNNVILNLGEDLYNGDLTLKKGERDDMGRPANKWKYKTEDVGTYAALDDLVFEAQDEVKRTTVYNTLGKTVYDDMKAGNVTLKVYVDGQEYGNAAFGYADLMSKDNSYAIGLIADGTKAATVQGQGTQFTGNGSTTQIFLTEDGDTSGATPKDLYTVVISNEYLVQATADYSTAREEVNVEWVTDDVLPMYNKAASGAAAVNTTTIQPDTVDTAISQDDFNVSDVKKDDYLVVTYSANNGYQTVKPATIVEGEITKYVSGDTVTIDGTLYKYAKKVKDDDKATDYSVGNKAILVTDGKYVLAVDDANATKDYVYLQDVGKSTGTSTNVAVALYGTDGALRDVRVKKITDKNNAEFNGRQLDTMANGTAVKGTSEANLYGWYTYSVDDSGVYTLKAIDKTTVKNTNYTNSTVSYNLNSFKKEFDIVTNENVNFLQSAANTKVGIKANNKTVFILLDDDDDITVYSGLTKAPTVTATGKQENGDMAYVSYIKDGDYASYVFIDVSNANNNSDNKTIAIDDSTLSNDYIMVVKQNSKKVNYETKDNGNAYYSNTVLFDGAITSKYFDKETNEGKVVGRLYHKIKTNNKDYITGMTAISSESTKDYAYGENMNSVGQPIDFSNGTVTIGGMGYLMNSDNSIYLVIGKGASPAKDENKDYTEYLGIGGSALKSYLSGKNFAYNYYGVRHDDNSNTLDALYVYVGSTNPLDAGALKSIDSNENYTTKGDMTVTGTITVEGGANVAVNGKLTVKSGAELIIDRSTVSATSVEKVSTAKITVKNGGKLYVDGALDIDTLTVQGCEVTVGGTAKIATLTVTGTKNDPAVVTFNKAATITNAILNDNSTTTFNVASNVTKLVATNADIVMNASVEVTDSANSKITGTSTVTLAGDTVLDSDITVDNTATVTASGTASLTVDISKIKNFDIKKAKFEGLTYTYETNKDTMVLSFTKATGKMSYTGLTTTTAEALTVTNKEATVEWNATSDQEGTITLDKTKHSGITLNIEPAAQKQN